MNATKVKFLPRTLLGMPILLWLLTLFRLALPFCHSPFDEITSDMQVHYDCGRYTTLFSPFAPNRTSPSWLSTDCETANALEPKPFQLLMALVSRNDPSVGNLLFGLFCASLVIGTFFSMKTVGASRARSTLAASFVGVCPTLTWSFSYFLNENLMLVLLLAGLWCVTRSLQPTLSGQEKFHWFCFSFWLFLFSSLTKMVALPAFVTWILMFGLAWIRLFKEHKRSVFAQAFLLLAMLTLFSLSTYRQTGFLNPMGKSLRSILLRKTGSCSSAIDITDQETGLTHSFGTVTPLCIFPIFGLSQFGAFKPIKNETSKISVSLQWAPLQWQRAIAEQTKNLTTRQKFSIWWQNLASGFTSPSFPEAIPEKDTKVYSPLLRLASTTSYASCFPLFFFLVFAMGLSIRHLSKIRSLAFFTDKNATWKVFLSLSILISWAAFILQQEGGFEPRYRKALDLLSILAVAQLMSYPRKKTGPVNGR